MYSLPVTEELKCFLKNIKICMKKNRDIMAIKILFLSAHVPSPHSSGGRIREFELIRRLGKSFKIYLCIITKNSQTDKKAINDLRCFCTSIKLFKVTPDDKKQRPSYSDQMKEHTSKKASYYISSLLRNEHFDVVHVEGYYLMQHLPIKLDTPILLVEHNIEYLLSLQRFRLAKTELEKSYYWNEYLSTLKWERIFWRRARICATLTKEDKMTMNQLEPDIDIRIIPNGKDHLKIKGQEPLSICRNFIVGDENYCVLFVGNFAYEPNIDAAMYLSQFIFPIIIRYVPNTKLFLVGNAPPPEIWSLKSNRLIEVTGYVDSLLPFYNTAHVVVCPLRIGGGIKLKILEALSTGKAIVSTSIGAQGLDLMSHKPVIIADEVSDFAKKVVWLLLNPKERHRQEEEALGYAVNIPNWDEVSEVLAKCYKEMIANRQMR